MAAGKGRKLARNVQVAGVLYGPDGEQDVPKDVLDQITNPKAFEELDDPTELEELDEAEPAKAAKKS
jgi:hypothetical protein